MPLRWQALSEAVEEQLGDLLVCLGQEEQKVRVLSDALEQCGQDPQAILHNHALDEQSLIQGIVQLDSDHEGQV